MAESLIRTIDPAGVEERKRHSLKKKVLWVSWTKLLLIVMKSSVFPIHGAVDGYSRIVMWLKVDRTSDDPEITAKVFSDWVEEVG